MKRPRQLRLSLQTLVERQFRRRLDALDANLGSVEPAGLAGDPAAEVVEDPRVLPHGGAVALDVADPGQAAALGHGAERETERADSQARVYQAIDDAVDQAKVQRFGGGDVLTAGDHFKRSRYADQAGQALGAAAARQDAELDLGQAEPRFLVGDPEVAGHRHLQSAAQRGTVNRRDERLG